MKQQSLTAVALIAMLSIGYVIGIGGSTNIPVVSKRAKGQDADEMRLRKIADNITLRLAKEHVGLLDFVDDADGLDHTVQFHVAFYANGAQHGHGYTLPVDEWLKLKLKVGDWVFVGRNMPFRRIETIPTDERD